MTGISIIVPVGPQKAYLQYLDECLTSIREQMEEEDEIVIIDDMADLDNTDWFYKWKPTTEQYIKNPWLLGCAAGWNIGVARSKNEWNLLMGSDDKLLPGCLEACRKQISHKPDPLGFYNLTIQLENGETHNVFNNAALVSKALWRYTGGFPLSAAVGAPDALLISIMMVHMPQHLHQLDEGKPLYWVRTHPEQETGRQQGLFSWECVQIRDKETARFTPKPEWANR